MNKLYGRDGFCLGNELACRLSFRMDAIFFNSDWEVPSTVATLSVRILARLHLQIARRIKKDI